MLGLIFKIAMLILAGKLLVWGLKATWGITKFVCGFILFPLVILALVFAGIIYLAIPILVVVGIFVLVRKMSEA